jgi:hypothetical protein
MLALLSTLVILLIAAGFYRTAARLNLPGLAWAIGGVVVYYGGFLFWMYLILPPVLGASFHSHGFWLGVGMDATAIAFGVAAAALFYFKVLMKKGQKPFEASF